MTRLSPIASAIVRFSVASAALVALSFLGVPDATATKQAARKVSSSPARVDAKAYRAAAEGTLKVHSLTLARKIEKRRASEVGQAFEADGRRVYAYLRVLNKGPEQRLRVTWRREGRVYHVSHLRVGRAPGWRTWAYIKARSRLAGAWTVTVERVGGAGEPNRDDKPLAEQRFVIFR